MIFHRTHEEEHDEEHNISFVLELTKSANSDNKSKPSPFLPYRLWLCLSVAWSIQQSPLYKNMLKCWGSVESNYIMTTMVSPSTRERLGSWNSSFCSRTDSFAIPFSVHIKLQTLQSGLASSYNICT